MERDKQKGEIRTQESMTVVAGADAARADTVLEEADRLLEEEGMVSSPLEATAKEQVEIQSEHEEPPDTASFAAKAKLFLTELHATEHSTGELVQQARAQNLEAVITAAEALATFM